MGLPFDEVFVGLLAVYLLYSAAVRLPSWYPVAGSLATLVVAMGYEAGGASDTANSLALYAFILFVGAIVLQVVDAVRARGPRELGAGGLPPGWEAPGDPSRARDRPADQPFDGLQQ